jgi:ATP-dependent protease Clp ATPase subunit
LPGGVKIDLAAILFIGGGAFTGLHEVMVRRGRHPEQPVTGDDLLASGMMPELARRCRVIAALAPLDEETLSRMASRVDLKGWTSES